MNKTKTFLSRLFVVTFYLYFIYGEIFGIIHSVKHHSTQDVVASVVIPPWAWWRSVEMWWHDDYADIDWDKRLSNDLRTSIYFMEHSNYRDVNKLEFYDDMDKFSTRINKYPEEKIKFLKEGTRKFTKYSNSMLIDILDSTKEYIRNGEFEWSSSSKTLQLKYELETFKIKDEIKFINERYEILRNQIITDFSRGKIIANQNLLKRYEMEIESAIQEQLNEQNRIFRNVFEEDL